MGTPLIHEKACSMCASRFGITDGFSSFLESISPVVNGVRMLLPEPSLCPDCRQRRRLLWRNERSLYRNTCAATNKSIISMYSPDKPYKVYEQSEWWSDKWDATSYGRGFDFSRGFFDQLNELMIDVPHFNLSNASPENSDYCNTTTGMRDCYLVFNSTFSQDCHYSKGLSKCNDVIDCLKLYESEHCYMCIDSKGCYDCRYLRSCDGCRDSQHCVNCDGCKNCFGCVGLTNAAYHIFNLPIPQSEYDEKIRSLRSDPTLVSKRMAELIASCPFPALNMKHCEACIGDSIFDSKNAYHCYDVINAEDVMHCYDVRGPVKDISDVTMFGNGVTASYELISSGLNADHIFFCENCWGDIRNLFYCSLCVNGCSDCFGCVGLKGKSYCIFNRQYTKDEYERLVPKIIDHMTKAGEWGEFFPPRICPFGYNETTVMEYFPLTRSEALELGFRWSDYENPKPDVSKIIPGARLPESIGEIPDDIINWAIECEVSGKPFRILKSELEFYRRHDLPIPRRHPDQRHFERMQLRNPRKLYDGCCDNPECESHHLEAGITFDASNSSVNQKTGKRGYAFKTTFSPDRSGIVYCERCYRLGT